MNIRLTDTSQMAEGINAEKRELELIRGVAELLAQRGRRDDGLALLDRGLDRAKCLEYRDCTYGKELVSAWLEAREAFLLTYKADGD